MTERSGVTAGTADTYEYAIVRVVPRIERGEQVNVGVLLHCRHRDHLTMRVHVDAVRLHALDPGLDLDAVAAALAAWEAAVRGEGPAGTLSPGERFRWMAAPRSTIVQAGAVHTGLTADPEAEVERLAQALVR